LHVSPFVLTWNLYAGVPGLQGTDSGPRGHLRRGSEPAGGANFLAPRSVILIFCSAVDEAPTINVKTSTAGPQEVPELKIWEHPPST
jgi:hypothetical protein